MVIYMVWARCGRQVVNNLRCLVCVAKTFDNNATQCGPVVVDETGCNDHDGVALPPMRAFFCIIIVIAIIIVIIIVILVIIINIIVIGSILF